MNSMGTGPTIRSPTARRCASGTSTPTSHDGGRPTAAAWGSIAGWRNEPFRGCIRSAACVSGRIAMGKSRRLSWPWLLPSSVLGSCDLQLIVLGALTTLSLEDQQDRDALCFPYEVRRDQPLRF